MNIRKMRRAILTLSPMAALLALLSACATRGPTEAEFETGFTPIRSEMLFSARYYDGDETLVVVRRSGDVFEYRGVPKALAEQLLASEDRDAFYRDHVEGRFGETKANFDQAPREETDTPAGGDGKTPDATANQPE